MYSRGFAITIEGDNAGTSTVSKNDATKFAKPTTACDQEGSMVGAIKNISLTSNLRNASSRCLGRRSIIIYSALWPVAWQVRLAIGRTRHAGDEGGRRGLRLPQPESGVDH